MVLENKTNKWFFFEITEATSHWQSIAVSENGQWNVNCKIFANRIS